MVLGLFAALPKGSGVLERERKLKWCLLLGGSGVRALGGGSSLPMSEDTELLRLRSFLPP